MRDLENNKAKVQKIEALDRKYLSGNTDAARDIVRQHMLDRYDDGEGVKDPVDSMMEQAEWLGKARHVDTDISKGKRLAESRFFGRSTDDARDLLSKVYNTKNVKRWSNDKAWDLYTGLIGREYARMAEEKRKGK